MNVHEARARVATALLEAGVHEDDILTTKGLEMAFHLGMAQQIECSTHLRTNEPITRWPDTCYPFMLVLVMYMKAYAGREPIEVYWERYNKRWMLGHGEMKLLHAAA